MNTALMTLVVSRVITIEANLPSKPPSSSAIKLGERILL